MKVLVTGGAGYIGSHTCVELLNEGYDIVVVDNFSNSSEESINRIKRITGKSFSFEEIDLCDKDALEKVFMKHDDIECIIHFAGLKSVKESTEIPLKYYENNLISTLNIIDIMQAHNIKNIVFSSSATVYGHCESMPITEDNTIGRAINPYGATKCFIEIILNDLYRSDSSYNIIILRYFNPIGAHESGLIGEDPKGVPNNLVPYIAQVAVGKLDMVHIYGNDYPTHDGTGVRDYIHVVDLAKGHIAAIKKIQKDNGLYTYNLGTGKGYSVLDVINSYEKACGKTIPYVVESRRLGDVAECYANAYKAYEEMGWKAKYSLDEMCESSWKWQRMNPNGY